METLGQKQRRFAKFSAMLINRAIEMGFEVAYGEVGRSDEQAEINFMGTEGRLRLSRLIKPVFPDLALKIENNGRNNGIAVSVHQLFLAVDLKLFRNGLYLTQDADYKPLGEWWKTLASDCRWGGDFPGDGNHFSIEHNGVK